MDTLSSWPCRVTVSQPPVNTFRHRQLHITLDAITTHPLLYRIRPPGAAGLTACLSLPPRLLEGTVSLVSTTRLLLLIAFSGPSHDCPSWADGESNRVDYHLSQSHRCDDATSQPRSTGGYRIRPRALSEQPLPVGHNWPSKTRRFITSNVAIQGG